VAGYPLDTKHPAIRETLRGIGRSGRRSAALTTNELKKLSRVCEPGLAGNRDRALLLTGFAGALRRSEQVGLDVERLTWSNDGVKLLLEKSKTDKEGEGAEVMMVYGRHEDTCPVSTLRRWLDAAAITAGPVFRKVNKAGRVEPRRLSEDAVRQVLLKRRAGGYPRFFGRARKSSRPSGRACHHGLSQRGPRRRNHVAHPASQLNHDEKLRAPSETEPESGWEARTLSKIMRNQRPLRSARWAFGSSVRS
jgi:integrase